MNYWYTIYNSADELSVQHSSALMNESCYCTRLRVHLSLKQSRLQSLLQRSKVCMDGRILSTALYSVMQENCSPRWQRGATSRAAPDWLADHFWSRDGRMQKLIPTTSHLILQWPDVVFIDSALQTLRTLSPQAPEIWASMVISPSVTKTLPPSFLFSFFFFFLVPSYQITLTSLHYVCFFMAMSLSAVAIYPCGCVLYSAHGNEYIDLHFRL